MQNYKYSFGNIMDYGQLLEFLSLSIEEDECSLLVSVNKALFC